MLDLLTDNLDAFVSGLWVTTRLVGASFVVALVLGTVVAALRVSPSMALARLGGVYVEIFRNIPLLVLLFIAFAGVRRGGIDITAWTAGILSLGVYTSAYVAEALRSGVAAVSRGQVEASLSLGFTFAQTLRRVVLPQAFQTVIQPLGSITIAMVKNSAIVGASRRRAVHRLQPRPLAPLTAPGDPRKPAHRHPSPLAGRAAGGGVIVRWVTFAPP